jgi:hypothetical protein
MSTTYYKLTNKECLHNGLQYKEGLNIDILDWNITYNCSPGGIYN